MTFPEAKNVDLESDIPHIPMHLIGTSLVATLQADLSDALLRQFQQDLLRRIQTDGVAFVIVDTSGVEIMDLGDFEMIRRTLAMASLMGARPVLVGLRAGIVASLIDLDGDVDGIEAVADLEGALDLRTSAPKTGAKDETNADNSGRVKQVLATGAIGRAVD